MSSIPDKESDFIEWSGNLIDISKKYATKWGLPGDKLSELETLHLEVKALHEKCQTATYTKLDMQAKNEKKGLLKKKEEEFVRFHLQNNDKMSDNGHRELRIPIYDKTSMPYPKPDAIPEIEILTPHPQTLRIRFRHEHSKRWGKPEFVYGLEVKLKIAMLRVSMLVLAMVGCATKPFPISDQMVKPIIDAQFPGIAASIETGAPVAVWWCDDERFKKAQDELYHITTIAYWIQAYLEQKLVDEKKFKPVTRTKLEAIFKEQEFQMSGHVDDETIVSVAKILGAKFMIVPTLTINNTINLQVLNSETGEIVYLSDNSVKEKQKIVK